MSQSHTDRGRSLWEAVFEYIERGGVVTRDAVLAQVEVDIAADGSLEIFLRYKPHLRLVACPIVLGCALDPLALALDCRRRP